MTPRPAWPSLRACGEPPEVTVGETPGRPCSCCRPRAVATVTGAVTGGVGSRLGPHSALLQTQRLRGLPRSWSAGCHSFLLKKTRSRGAPPEAGAEAGAGQWGPPGPAPTPSQPWAPGGFPILLCSSFFLPRIHEVNRLDRLSLGPGDVPGPVLGSKQGPRPRGA